MYAKLEPYENTWIYLPLSTILILHHFQLFGWTCMYLIGLSRLCDLSFICFDGPPVVDHQPFFYSIRLLIVAFYQMGVWSVYFRTSEAFFCASNFKVPSKYLEVPQTVKCKGEGAGDVTASNNCGLSTPTYLWKTERSKIQTLLISVTPLLGDTHSIY